MKRSVGYNTKQRDAILHYIRSLEDSHVTAAQIVGHFEKEQVAIGRTTIYRHLDKLTESGEIRRYTTDGVSGACFQYNEHVSDCYSHLHLKCEDCGDLMHLEDDILSYLTQQIFDKCSFQINAMRTVLYGKCSQCSNK